MNLKKNKIDQLFLGLLLFTAIILFYGLFHSRESPSVGLRISFLMNIAMLFPMAFYIISNGKFISYKNSLNFVFFINVTLLCFKAIFFDFYADFFPANFYKSSFVFGHFADYFVLFNHDIINKFELVKTGYFPFSLVCFKAYAKLFGLSEASHHVGLFDILVYNFIFIGMYLVVIRNYFSKFKQSALDINFLYIFILISYIFSFGYERGNPSFISFFLFSFLIIELLETKPNDERKKSNDLYLIMIATLFFSIKVLNLTFLYLIFRVRKDLLVKIVSAFFIFNFLISLFLVNFDMKIAFDLIVDSLLASVHSSVNFSDANSVLGTSSYNAFFIALKNIGNTFSQDANSIPQEIRSLFLIIGALTLVAYSFFTRPNVVKDALIIILIPIFFHHSNADYNLQLLIPIFLYILLTDADGKYFDIMKYLMLFFLMINLFPFSYINCCDVIGRMNSITLKSLIFPLITLVIIFQLFKKNTSLDNSNKVES